MLKAAKLALIRAFPRSRVLGKCGRCSLICTVVECRMGYWDCPTCGYANDNEFSIRRYNELSPETQQSSG